LSIELSIAQLIDALITASNAVWHLQDKINQSNDKDEVAVAAKQLLAANAQRRRLVVELDQAFVRLAEGQVVKADLLRPTYE